MLVVPESKSFNVSNNCGSNFRNIWFGRNKNVLSDDPDHGKSCVTLAIIKEKREKQEKD